MSNQGFDVAAAAEKFRKGRKEMASQSKLGARELVSAFARQFGVVARDELMTATLPILGSETPWFIEVVGQLEVYRKVAFLYPPVGNVGVVEVVSLKPFSLKTHGLESNMHNARMLARGADIAGYLEVPCLSERGQNNAHQVLPYMFMLMREMLKHLAH